MNRSIFVPIYIFNLSGILGSGGSYTFNFLEKKILKKFFQMDLPAPFYFYFHGQGYNFFSPLKELVIVPLLGPIIMVWVSIPLMMTVAEQLLMYLLLIYTAFEDYMCIQILRLLSHWAVLSFVSCVSSSHSLPRHSLQNRRFEILYSILWVVFSCS